MFPVENAVVKTSKGFVGFALNAKLICVRLVISTTHTRPKILKHTMTSLNTNATKRPGTNRNM